MINLRKGGVLNLRKGDQGLSSVSLGLSWDGIVKKGLWKTTTQAVDLDASAVTYDSFGNVIDICYFGKLKLGDYVKHMGDDRTGSDSRGDQDNETIQVFLDRVPDDVETIVFTLNAYCGTSFHLIPNARIRLYEGTTPPAIYDDSLGRFEIGSDSSFKNQKSMIMGKVSRRNGKWNFVASGAVTPGSKFQDTARAASTMLKQGTL